MLAIIDPTCILATGHNIDANRIFSEIFQKSGVENEVHTCIGLQVEEEYLPANFNKTLQHFYALDGSSITDNFFEASELDLQKILLDSRYDSFFFLNADLITIKSLLTVLDKNDELKQKKICMRLIGVLENHFPGDPADIETPLQLLKDNLNIIKDSNFIIATETQKYSQKISGYLGVDVKVVPYPIRQTTDAIESLNKASDKKIISMLGQARGDKGYFRLLEIITSVQDNLGHNAVEFRIQRMNPNFHEFDKNYESELEKMSSLVSLPVRLSAEQMVEELILTDLVMLPYCVEGYKYRGSAMLFDSIAYNKPIITFDGSAFAEEVKAYDLGYVVSVSNQDFSQKIIQFLNENWRGSSQKFVDFQHQTYESLCDFFR